MKPLKTIKLIFIFTFIPIVLLSKDGKKEFIYLKDSYNKNHTVVINKGKGKHLNPPAFQNPNEINTSSFSFEKSIFEIDNTSKSLNPNSDNCSYFFDTIVIETMLKPWVETLELWKQGVWMERIDSMRKSVKFYTKKRLPYEQVAVTRSEAAKEYDLFVKQNKSKSFLPKITNVLRFVYENMRNFSPPYLNDSMFQSPSFSAKDLFIEISQENAGGMCGQYARFTGKILNDLGIRSCEINMSALDSVGNFIGLHNVVGAIKRNKTYVLDPMFPRYYRVSGKPIIDLVSMRKLVEQHKNAEIIPVYVPHGPMHYLATEYDTDCTTEPNELVYFINPNLIRLDSYSPDTTFIDRLHWPIDKDQLIQNANLVPDYFSWFHFINSIDNIAPVFAKKRKKITPKGSYRGLSS